jgi:hypothetical protein
MRLIGDWVEPNRIFSAIEELPPDLDWADIYVRSLRIPPRDPPEPIP